MAKNETILESPQGNEIEQIQKEKQSLEAALREKEEVILRQQAMMLNRLVVNNDDPFASAVMLDESPIIAEIQKMREAHLSGEKGLTQKEASEIYRLQNQILKNRKNTLNYEDRGNIGEEDRIPRTMGDRLKLNFKVPPGYTPYVEVDTPSLNGRLLREKLAMGYRFMQNDGTIRCEADCDVSTPEFRDSGIVFRRAGTYHGEPATHYLMVTDKVFSDARKQSRADGQREESIGRVESSVNQFDSELRGAGMNSDRSGKGLQVWH